MVGPGGYGDPADEGGRIPDLTKKIVTLGLGAYFLTEDTLRRYVKEAKLPRDVAKAITQNASRGKDELYGFIARELSNFLEKMDLQEEVDKFVKTHKIRINAEIEFVSREPVPEDPSEVGEDEEARPVEWNVRFGGGAESLGTAAPETDPC
ncbi:MAG: hypothetical protein D6731_19365 [Planctomycetota bacterium]|nr:MAG: hypothetical protein D6731_19365 [Planctomycetota bacterium]